MDKNANKYLEAWLKKVEGALARYERVPKRSVRLLLSDEDMWRLMNWKTWSLRYAVSLDFILTTLMDYFCKVRRKRPDGISLGVKMHSLTGDRAQEIIERAVEAAYPDGENFIAKQVELRNLILGQRLYKFSSDLTLQENIKLYREHIQKQKERNVALSKRYTRPWRGNPFK